MLQSMGLHRVRDDLVTKKQQEIASEGVEGRHLLSAGRSPVGMMPICEGSSAENSSVS